MSMVVAGSALMCGTSFVVAVWVSDTGADVAPKAQVHRIGGQTIVIQPGPRAAKMPSPERQEVQVAHQKDDFPPFPPPTDVTPAPRDEFAPPVPEAAPATAVDSLELAKRYRQIYNAIPFDRTEYEANPSYRHEAAMEILFGKMRPTVMQRSHTVIDVHEPPVMPMAIPYSPYGFNSYFFPFFSPGYRVHRSF